MQCLLNYLCKAGRMKQITLFFSFCWILWFSQIFAISTMFSGIQNMPANPAVITLGEKTPELIVDNYDNDLTKLDDMLNKTDHHDNRIKISSSSDASSTAPTISNDFVILSEVKSSIKSDTISSHDISPDERLQQINDSGGGGGSSSSSSTSTNEQIQVSDENIIDINNNNNNDTLIKNDIPITSTIPTDVNLTTEEHPIPVFSEWAQKQMEEAEKQLEKDVVNSSTMKKNSTNGIGKQQQLLKFRTKNYASPDCGAKIIASNIEAQNTGALLTTSKDEYMLSPCTNRIWFVVELCEAIQAKQIDLANFELFSSSPKNFTVGVSNRYPIRDWSNVGRFIAEDSRNIQSFELYPHLFGKYVRVDIHSHYNSEHFCPISLFRVYGTSEFEAFETENRNPYDDDIDDDIVVTGIDNNDIDDINILMNDNDNLIRNQNDNNNNNNIKKENQNLFKSASDAVMSIVKKAAQVLVKEKPNQTDDITTNDNNNNKLELCFTSNLINFQCNDCSQTFIKNVNYLLSCKYDKIIKLLNINMLKNDILKSRICGNRFNIDIMTVGMIPSSSTTTLNNLNLNDNNNNNNSGNSKDIISKTVSMAFQEQNSFYLSIIALDYLAAMCHILNQTNLLLKEQKNHYNNKKNDKDFINDSALNLTIDKKSISKQKNDDFINDNNIKMKKNDIEINNEDFHNDVPINDNNDIIKNINNDIINNLDNNKESTQIPMPPLHNEEYELQKQQQQQKQQITDSKETTDGVNIFNLVIDDDDNNDVDDKNLENYLELEDQKQHNSATIINDNIKLKDDKQIDDIKENNIDEIITTAVPTTVPTITIPTVTSSPSVIKNKDNTDESQSWDSLDKLLSEQMSSEQISSGNNINFGGTAANYQVNHKSGHHSESVFIRLSNRIKALERNMSLSGQYLEELSRRYKKQVEELQNSFAKTLNAIEEQNRRAAELEQFLIEQNYNLKENLEDLSQKFYFWISILLCVATVVLIHVLISWYSVNSIGRKQLKLLEKYEECSMVNNKKIIQQNKLYRRKSVEGVSGHPTPTHKTRRPSEQAMRIAGSYKDLMIFEEDENNGCVGGNNINNNSDNNNQINKINNDDDHHNDEKLTNNNNNEFTWSKSQFKPERRISSISTSSSPIIKYEEIFPRQRKSSVFYNKDNQPFQLIQQFVNSKTKKLIRQESAPGDYIQKDNNIINTTTSGSSGGGGGIINLNNSIQQKQQQQKTTSGIPEEILIIDDDYENYVPGSDLVYNEFMPDGPSGQQYIEQKKLNGNLFKKSKLRKLSSPGGFLKSTFSKNINHNNSNSNNSNSNNNGGNNGNGHINGGNENINKIKSLQSTESTGWEWYRLKKFNSDIKSEPPHSSILITQNQQQQSNNKNLLKPEIIVRINGNGTVSSCGSVGSSTSKTSDGGEFLILNSSNCSESDSLITTNSEDISTATTRCKNSSGPGGDSTTTTVINNGSNNLINKRNSKKQRSFKKIFKKVF